MSRQTVSNVIHGTGRVGPATAQRVQEHIARLGYTLHLGASSLRSQRIRQVAHPTHPDELDTENILGMEFLQRLARTAGDYDHHLLVVSDPSPEGMRELITSGRADGFIFSDMAANDERARLATRMNVPFAAFGRTSADSRQAWVDVDNGAGTRMATEHLLVKGHRSVAFLGFESTAYWDAERQQGYEHTMGSAGLPTRIVLVPNTPERIGTAARRLLADTPAPSAVVCAADTLAASIYTAAAESGRTIGQDVFVTGFDGSVLSRSLTPRLTTVRIPLEAITHRVMERYLRELEQLSDDPGEFVPLQLALGESA